MALTTAQQEVQTSAFVETATRHFDAAAAGRLLQRQYEIGGRCVRFLFAGESPLNWLSPALEHRRTECLHDDLVIRVWESDDSPLRAIDGFSPEELPPIRVHGQSPWILGRTDIKLIQWYFGDTAFVCCANFRELPSWESALPLRSLLNCWFSSIGGLVHGAAVGDDQSAVLLAGVGGSGKSSTAISCLAEPDLFHLGDDLCLITGDTDVPMVHSLYNACKLWPDNLPRFADLSFSAPAHVPRHEDKEMFFLYPEYRHKLAAERPLRAILLPRVSGEATTRITKATAGEAWHSIVPVSLRILSNVQPEGLQTIAEIIKRLPVYRVELGTQRSELTAAIRRFLREGMPD